MDLKGRTQHLQQALEVPSRTIILRRSLDVNVMVEID